MIVKAILIGALTAVIIVGVIFCLSMLVTMETNEIIHTADITVVGKICNDKIYGTSISKIQTENGVIYFIPTSNCDAYPIGRRGMIFYNRICNLPVKDPGPLDGYCFNRAVGDY